MSTMQQQAKQIDDVFSAFSVACRVASPPNSFRASSYHSFAVERRPDVKVSKVTALAPELGEALGVPVRFDDMPLSIEVRRPDPQRLKLTDLWALLQKTPREGLHTVTGEMVKSGKLMPALVNLAHPNTPHALIAGTTGSGKTALLISMLLSSAIMRSPNELSLVVLDPKAVDFRTIYGLPHLAGQVVTEPSECVAALAAVVAEMERRKTTGMLEPRQKIIVAIDEIAELMAIAGSEVEGYIQRIISVGRGLGIHLIGATQKPSADVVGSVIKANFPVRIVGRVMTDSDAKVAAGISGTGAESLPGMGSFLVVNGATHRVQSFYATAEEQVQLVSMIGGKWAGQRTHFSLHLDDAPKVTERVEIAAMPQSSADYPAWLVPAIRSYTNKHGKPPSQRRVQTKIQERTGKMLPWPLVKAALQDAM